MPLSTVSIIAVCDTEAHAEGLVGALAGKFVGKPVDKNIGGTGPQVGNADKDVGKDGNVRISTLSRFTSKSDRDLIVSDAISAFDDPSNGVVSARIATHECTHADAKVLPCIETTVYEK